MNCKPGDLAIQIKSAVGNEGRICHVLQSMGENPVYDGGTWYRNLGHCWLVRFASKAKNNAGQYYLECPVPDSWLRPVSGLPEVETTDDRIKEPA